MLNCNWREFVFPTISNPPILAIVRNDVLGSWDSLSTKCHNDNLLARNKESELFCFDL